jgi:hypothetical protein
VLYSESDEPIHSTSQDVSQEIVLYLYSKSDEPILAPPRSSFLSHGPHTLDGLQPRAPHTTLLRPAQRLGNDPDASHAYICLASPCVHRSHHAIAAPAVSVELGYTNANAICVVTTFHSKSNGTGDGYNEDHNTASPCVHRSHHAIAAPAVSVELSCAIAAPAKPVELSCAIAAPDLSVELSYAVGLPAHGHYSTQHHEVSAYCLDNNTSTPTPMITPMRTPASTPAAPIAALDTRIAPTQPPPSPNVMMTTTLDNLSMTGSAMSDPLRPVRRGCSDTGHTATALCTCNVHRLAAPNANINKSMTTTRSGRRPPSTHNVALPVALLLPSGTTQQIESDLTSIVASDPTTITAGPSLWPSQSRSTECREGPPNQAPADHANVLTYLARRGSRYSLQCTLCWRFSWTLAFLALTSAFGYSSTAPAAPTTCGLSIVAAIAHARDHVITADVAASAHGHFIAITRVCAVPTSAALSLPVAI